MENRAQFVMVWLGLIRMGAAAALVNTNLVGAPLAHSITVAGATDVIVSHALADRRAVREAMAGLPALNWWQAGGAVPIGDAPDLALPPTYRHLDPLLSHQSIILPPARAAPVPTSTDVAFYIYTSGTTGMPKAVRLTHLRIFRAVLGLKNFFGARARARACVCVCVCMSRLRLRLDCLA